MRRLALFLLLLAFGLAGCATGDQLVSRTSDHNQESSAAPVPATTARAQAPEPTPDYLALAAERLDRGDDAGALPYLRAYVAASPEAVQIRAYLAELHLRLGQHAEARSQFERFIHDASEMTGAIRKQLVHAQTRLLEIAQLSDDTFETHLRRGIGLVLLVRQWEAEKLAPEDAPTESTLVKAAEALRNAREERPDDPRPSIYLEEVYSRLGQPSAAQSARRAARAAGPGVGLTASEQSGW